MVVRPMQDRGERDDEAVKNRSRGQLKKNKFNREICDRQSRAFVEQFQNRSKLVLIGGLFLALPEDPPQRDQMSPTTQ